MSGRAHLIALAGRSTGFTGVWAGRGVGDEVGVGRTLRALAGARVYVVSSRAGHAGGAGGLAAESTSPATRGHAIHGVADRDGVDPRHVVEPLTQLRGRNQSEKGRTKMYYVTPSAPVSDWLLQAVIYIAIFKKKKKSLCLHPTVGWFSGKPMCMKQRRFLP